MEAGIAGYQYAQVSICIIKLFGHCIATWYAMPCVKLMEIGTSLGCG